MDDTLPVTLRVPIPAEDFERNQGVYSVRHPSAERIIFRLQKRHRDLIQQAAGMIDMSEASFVRCSAVNMAKAILAEKEKHNERDDPSDRSG